MTAAPTLPQGSLARALLAAARVVAAVRAGRSLSAALGGDSLPDDIRAQVQDLAYGALRRYGIASFVLGRLLDRPLPDATAEGILHTALYRLESRPESAYAVVDQAVDAAGRLLRGQYRGLTNAVLRNYLRRREALLADAAKEDEAAWWHPQWWVDGLREAYPDAWQSVLSAGNQLPPMTLRVNRRRSDVGRSLDELAAAGIEARALGGDAIRLLRPQPVESLPGFAAGRVSVQDAGAQRAAELLGAVDGESVLDACAAPGGKTSHILERAAVDLLALDVDAVRCRRIEENLGRLGLAAKVAAGDAAKPASWWDGRSFDRILADVPCSATGVVRRHPDAKWLRRASDIEAFAKTQDRLLDALWPLLKPGGEMLYATCSVFPRENGERIDAFVRRTPDAAPVPIDGLPSLQLLPTDDHDGFFYARLRKTA